jgi:hypothetical protein
MSSDDQKVVGLDEEDVNEEVKLTSSRDSRSFNVLKSASMISELCQKTLENDSNATEIQVDVAGDILEAVVTYMAHHKGREPALVEKPLRSKIMAEVCDPWDAQFVDEIPKVGLQKLYDLIMAANYMSINSLLHLGCAKVASLIKDQV